MLLNEKTFVLLRLKEKCWRYLRNMERGSYCQNRVLLVYVLTEQLLHLWKQNLHSDEVPGRQSGYTHTISTDTTQQNQNDHKKQKKTSMVLPQKGSGASRELPR